MKKHQIGRTKKAVVNTVAIALKEIVAFLCNFILPRLILGAYGSEFNGLISSITQFLNAVAILRLGVAGATRASLYKTLNSDNNVGTSAVVNSAQSYLKKTGLVVAIYVIALAFCFPLFSQTVVSFSDIFILVIALGMTTVSQYVFGLTYVSLLEADQKTFIVAIFETIFSIFATSTACALILLKVQLPYVELIVAAIWVLFPVLICLIARKKYKINNKVPKDNELLKTKNDAMAHSIANILHENVDVVSLTIFCPQTLLSVYAVYKLVTAGMKQTISVFTRSLEAPFGELWAKKYKEIIKNSLDKYEYALGFISIVLFSCSLLLIVPFVKLYTSGVNDIEYSRPLFGTLLVICEFVYCLRIPYQTLVQAAGHYKQTKKAAFLEAFINVSLTFLLVWKFDIVGAVIGTLIANMFRTIYYSCYVNKKIIERQNKNDHSTRYFFWVVLSTITVYVALYKLNDLYAYIDWYHWVLLGFIDAFVAIIITFSLAILFNTRQNFNLPHKIRCFLRKRK